MYVPKMAHFRDGSKATVRLNKNIDLNTPNSLML